MTIKRLTAEDAAALRVLRLEAVKTAASAFSSSYEEEAARPPEWFSAVAAGSENDAILGAFDAGTLVGMVGFVASTRVKERHKGALVGLYVKPAFRRRGIARRLLECAIANASKRVLLLHVDVRADNAAAAELYRQLGFDRYGIEPKALLVDGQFHDCWLLARDVSKPLS